MDCVTSMATASYETIKGMATDGLGSLCSADTLTQENFWLALPVVGDIYMLGITLYDNAAKDLVPDQAKGIVGHTDRTARDYMELNDKNGTRLVMYSLAKVVSFFCLAFFELIPLLGAFAASFGTMSYLLYIGVVAVDTYFIARNITEREKLLDAGNTIVAKPQVAV